MRCYVCTWALCIRGEQRGQRTVTSLVTAVRVQVPRAEGQRPARPHLPGACHVLARASPLLSLVAVRVITQSCLADHLACHHTELPC